MQRYPIFSSMLRKPCAIASAVSKIKRPPAKAGGRDKERAGASAMTFCKSLLARQMKNQRSVQFGSIRVWLREFCEQMRDRLLLFRRTLLSICQKLGSRFILSREILGRDPRVMR